MGNVEQTSRSSFYSVARDTLSQAHPQALACVSCILCNDELITAVVAAEVRCGARENQSNKSQKGTH